MSLKIASIYFNMTSFVKKDLEILQKHFDVKYIQWNGKRNFLKAFKERGEYILRLSFVTKIRQIIKQIESRIVEGAQQLITEEI